MQRILQDLVGKYKQKIDEELAREIERRIDEARAISPHLEKVLQAMKELSVGGKRLRGILVIVGYEMAGKKVDEEIIKAAVVMELFHLGLLMQDDVMDGDSMRRGVATIHSRYESKAIGEALATLAGDLTFGWGMEILANLKSQISNSQITNAMGVWGKYFTRVGYGQMLDVQDIADEATILQILSIKSGEYSCILPLLFGATLGSASGELKMRLEKYGMELGLTFQLRDDWLGMWGDPRETGKPAGEQGERGKKTYATMFGKEKTEETVRQHLDLAIQLSEGNEILEGLAKWSGERVK